MNISPRLPLARRLLVIGLLAIYWLLAVSATRDKCTTFDEIIHLTAGYSYWLTADYRLDSENGALPSCWGALPLLAMKPAFPLQSEGWLTGVSSGVHDSFFYHLGNDPQPMLLAARVTMALLGVLLAATVFAWSRRLWGDAGGFLSLVLCVFAPNLLAHGPLVTSDVAAALFFTLAVWAWWTMLHRLNIRTVALAALALGALLLAKMSAVLFAPMALLMIAIRLANPAPLPAGSCNIADRTRQFVFLATAGLLVILGAAFCLWAWYGFRYSMFNGPVLPGRMETWELIAARPNATTSLVLFLRDHRLLPEGWLYGFSLTLRHASRPSFLLGENSSIGFPAFFPVAFLLKTPLPLLLLFPIAVASIVHLARRESGRAVLYHCAPLLILSAVYWVFALQTSLNIGDRHLLPVYPAFFILTGAAASTFAMPKRAPRWIVAALLAWYVIASCAVYPNYLAYFNALAGGPKNGYRTLVDSSLDWGQALPGLRRWLDAHDANSPEKSCLAYFGTGDPAYYGIRATRLDTFEGDTLPTLRGGLYCISATTLQSVYTQAMGKWCVPYEIFYRELLATPAPLTPVQLDKLEHLRLARLCAFLRHREPDADVGHSILIYHLTDDDLHTALLGTPAELEPDIDVAPYHPLNRQILLRQLRER